jgi:hypothetical protein
MGLSRNEAEVRPLVDENKLRKTTSKWEGNYNRKNKVPGELFFMD